MNMLLTLAWRNIWRNTRRTLITAASIAFAVLLSVLLFSVKEGLLDKMQENAVGYYTGYIQIHQDGYWDDQNMDNTFLSSDSLIESVSSLEHIKNIVPRLESFALAASEKKSKGCMVVGIAPEQENKITKLKEKIIDGQYLKPGDEAVILGEELARYLELELNDTLVIIGQGYHGVSAAAKYPIMGIIKFGSPDLNARLVYLPLKSAQSLFGAKDRLTALVLDPDEGSESKRIAADIQRRVGSDFEVMPWQEMLPELEQVIQGEDKETYMFLFVLYVLISFGIFGTILMMTMERKYEFGVLIAIGMKKRLLSLVLVVESILIAFLGAISGLLFSVPIVYYFYLFPVPLGGELAKAYESFGIEPIYYFSVEAKVFLIQAFIVLIVALILSCYPVISISRIVPVKAMRE